MQESNKADNDEMAFDEDYSLINGHVRMAVSSFLEDRSSSPSITVRSSWQLYINDTSTWRLEGPHPILCGGQLSILARLVTHRCILMDMTSRTSSMHQGHRRCAAYTLSCDLAHQGRRAAGARRRTRAGAHRGRGTRDTNPGADYRSRGMTKGTRS